MIPVIVYLHVDCNFQAIKKIKARTTGIIDVTPKEIWFGYRSTKMQLWISENLNFASSYMNTLFASIVSL